MAAREPLVGDAEGSTNLAAGASPRDLAPRYYRPELDVLRFGAFFLVFLSHVVPGDAAFYAQARIPAAIARLIVSGAAGGAFGVDLFFALSSFLITTLLLREHALNGAIDIRAFYARRVLRIWPLYFAFLLIVLPLLHRLLPADDLPPRYLLAFLLLAGNWAFVWWGLPHSAAGPLWSVSIEEQFYLAWPLVLRRWRQQLPWIVALLLVIASGTRLVLVEAGAVHPQVWCNTLARLDPIACGALLALAAQRTALTPGPWVRGALLVLAGTIFVTVGHYEDFSGGRVLVTFPAIALASSALIAAALGCPTDLRRHPVLRALAYLGRISYGLYVFNLLFIELCGVAAAHAPLARLARSAFALAATVALAALSYRFLERPFLRLKARLAPVASRPI